MAEIYEPQSDSDDDCEVYFLKPVNEYNIVDKIKEANKELFANAANLESRTICNTTIESESTINISMMSTTTNTNVNTTTIDTTTATTTKVTTMRKVTFAPNLEDYEPESPSKGNTDDNLSDDEDLAEIADSSLKRTKFPTIDEEEQTAEPSSSSLLSSHQFTLCALNDCANDENSNLAIKHNNEDDYNGEEEDDVDEICEDIIVMEMKSNTIATKTIRGRDTFSAHHRRAVLKQTTFDCDEDTDNRSLMNLLTASDNEEDDSRCIQTPEAHDSYNDNDGGDNDNYNDENDDSIFNGLEDDFDDEIDIANSIYPNDNDHNDDGDDDDDDNDDKLSLIVASYLPDDLEHTMTISPTTTKTTSSTKQQTCCIEKNHSYFKRRHRSTTATTKTPNNNNKSQSLLSLGKRFQLHRKAYSTNSIGAINTTDSNNEYGNAPIDIKLNYKTCCEYRNSMRGRLPKYTGYLSEYGLSQEQLQQREQKLQKKQRFVLEKAIKTNEQDMQKMQDNERAFTTWLRNKMRYPINKTRNMFDVKLKLTGKKKTSSSNFFNNNGNSNSSGSGRSNGNGSAKSGGPLGCVGKLRTKS